jgi:hypothetical protein
MIDRKLLTDWPKRTLITLGCIGSLMTIYLFQDFEYDAVFSSLLQTSFREGTSLAINKISRFILNDLCAILLIYALFYERKYVLFAIIVQIMGFVFLMFTYLIMRLYLNMDEGPLSYVIHRL